MLTLSRSLLPASQEKAPLAGEVRALGLNDFDFVTTIGEGSFGKVMLVRKKEDTKLFAMKVKSPNPNPDIATFSP